MQTYIYVSELLTYAPVRKDLLRIPLYVYGFLFLPLALQAKYYFAKLFTLVLLFPKSFMPGILFTCSTVRLLLLYSISGSCRHILPDYF